MTEVVKAKKSNLPDLVQPQGILDLTPEDVQLPSLKIAQPGSESVNDGTAKAGAIISSFGDGDADVLDVPVRFYVIGLDKWRSEFIDGRVERYDFLDSSHPNAWRYFQYLVVAPDVDTSVPFKLGMTKSNLPIAKLLNSQLRIKAIGKPSQHIAFELTTKEKQHSASNSKYFVYQLKAVESTDEELKVVSDIAVQMAAYSEDTGTTPSAAPVDTPDI